MRVVEGLQNIQGPSIKHSLSMHNCALTLFEFTLVRGSPVEPDASANNNSNKNQQMVCNQCRLQAALPQRRQLHNCAIVMHTMRCSRSTNNHTVSDVMRQMGIRRSRSST